MASSLCRQGVGCGSGSGGCLAFEFPDPFFHFLARFERDDEFLGHVDLLAGPRVACFSSRPPLDLEDPEVSQFDSSIFDQRLDDGIERLLDDLLGLELSQTNLFGYRFDDLFFGHGGTSPHRGHLRRFMAAGKRAGRQPRMLQV